jgi:membrane protein
VLGTALAVHRRYGDLKGNALAGSLAFTVFTSMLPLLLVVVAVAGYASSSGVDVAGGIIRQLGLTGDAASSIQDAITTAQDSRQVASVLGLAGLLWSGLGLVGAFQYVFNQAWQVEERGLKDKAIGAVWLAGAAVLFVAAAAVTTLLRWLPGPTAVLAVVLAFVVNLALWVWSFRILPNTKLSIRTVLPGAIAGAAGLEVLKIVGAVYVPRAVGNSSQLYGTLGVVVAVLAWLYLFGRLVVYATAFNVVRHEHRAGTVTATIEVPRQPGADPSDEASRAGRLDRADLAA